MTFTSCCHAASGSDCGTATPRQLFSQLPVTYRSWGNHDTCSDYLAQDSYKKMLGLIKAVLTNRALAGIFASQPRTSTNLFCLASGAFEFNRLPLPFLQCRLHGKFIALFLSKQLFWEIHCQNSLFVDYDRDGLTVLDVDSVDEFAINLDFPVGLIICHSVLLRSLG